jgi:hypothetical protein
VPAVIGHRLRLLAAPAMPPAETTTSSSNQQHVGMRMVYVPVMTTPLRACAQWTDLTQAEMTALADLPEPHHYAPVESVACELERGHPGAHFAMGQDSGEEPSLPVWLRWTDAERSLVPVTEDNHCGAEGISVRPEDADDDEPWVCELPDDHLGAHSWQIETSVGGRNPSDVMAKRLEAIMAEIENGTTT